jgi:hypothetical protein
VQARLPGELSGAISRGAGRVQAGACDYRKRH